MQLKIITLNIWRFYNWNEREKVLLEYFRRENADIILLQEAQYDEKYYGENQVKVLSKELNYQYTQFSSTGLKYHQAGMQLDKPVQIGQGVLSKFPIKHIETIFLKQNPEDKEKRLLLSFAIEIGGKEIQILNVHFSNKDDWAESHFGECLDYCNSKRIYPIIAGDFNIKIMDKLKLMYEENFQSSSDIYDYTSYPSKSETLDYFLIPKNFRFLEFSTGETISDHSPLAAIIELH